MARNTKTSRKAAASSQKFAKQTRRVLLDTLCKCIHEDSEDTNGKLPYGYMRDLVKENKIQWPWMTRDTVNGAYHRYKKALVAEIIEDIPDNRPGHVSVDSSLDLSDITPASIERAKGGRPSGTTHIQKRRKVEKVIALKNDITMEYKNIIDNAKKRGRRVENGALENLIETMKEKKDLRKVDIKLHTIRQRINRNTLIVTTNQKGGHRSPLKDIEETVIEIIFQMARIRQCLSPSRGLALVNSLIDGHPLQENLIDWKRKYSSNTKGSVGKKYWSSFMNRNSHRLVSVRGQKYELDRQNWTTYANFSHMYTHTLDEMVHAGVARKLPEPCWKNRCGNVCPESEAYGCEVTHELCHPSLCFVGDEVGGNINMKGDGHAGGQKFLTRAGTVPYKKSSSSEKRFTLIGLTALDGNPVICIIIIKGKIPQLDVESGIDVTITPEGEPSDLTFF